MLQETKDAGQMSQHFVKERVTVTIKLKGIEG